jgi:hypothetical protein
MVMSDENKNDMSLKEHLILEAFKQIQYEQERQDQAINDFHERLDKIEGRINCHKTEAVPTAEEINQYKAIIGLNIHPNRIGGIYESSGNQGEDVMVNKEDLKILRACLVTLQSAQDYQTLRKQEALGVAMNFLKKYGI